MPFSLKRIFLCLGTLVCLALATAGWLLSARADEVGTNDFRISHDMGPDGNAAYGVYQNSHIAVAYNSTNDEYLVVWGGDANTGALANNEYEIYGQRIDAATGAEIGSDFRISDMGPDGNAAYDAYGPNVVYNPTSNEYLVVWYGDDNTAPLVEGDVEIFAQRIDASTGVEVGTNDFKISSVGPEGNTWMWAYSPKAVYNRDADEYLVVFSADTIDNDFARDIFGQRLDGTTGAEIGTNDFRISDMGPDGVSGYDGDGPGVVYNPTNNEYFVTWYGDDNTAPLVNDEWEVFGQRLDATTGAEVGTNDFRISDMGPDGNAAYGVYYSSAVAYNSTNNEYLVVWNGDDDTAPLVDNEYEIYGQRIDAATGEEIGTNDFRISDMGSSDGNTAYNASYQVTVNYNTANNEYLVIWIGDDDTAPLVDEEYEVFGQRIDAATGEESGTNDFRISDMGPVGNTAFGAYPYSSPHLTYNPTNNEYLAIWTADDNTGLLIDEEYEIYGQRLKDAKCTNGFLDAGEECDDGGESADCNSDCTAASCGDGLINATAGEECDAAGANSDVTSDACRSDCTNPSCGDGVVDTGEGCDDGNASNTDACLDTCVSATCGDGIIQSDVEECDSGGSNSDTTADACRSNCTDHRCGDSVVDTDEECDDGNVIAGDGCNVLCGIEGTPVGVEIASDNSGVNFDHLRTGETISLSAPDPRNLSALTIKKTALPATCSCAWSLNPESFGTFSDSAACETQFTLAEEGEGVLGVSVDCGAEGSGTFQQSLTVVQPWGVTGIGGCSLF